MQETPPPSQPSGPGIDIGGIVDGIVNGFREILTGWANELPAQLAFETERGVRDSWGAFWFSGANLLGTPLDLTLDYPASRLLGREFWLVLSGIAAMAVALLALRMVWRTIKGGDGALADAVDSVLFGVLLASMSTIVVGLAFLLTVQASQAIGNVNYAPALQQTNAFSNFMVWGIAVLLMIFYGWRLWVRSAYRIVLLMFLAPFAPVASILWMIPQTRWVAKLYWINLAGWLAGGFLAVAAVSMGFQIATNNNSNALVTVLFSVALLQLAHDLMGLLPSAFSGSLLGGSPRMNFSGAGPSVGTGWVAAGGAAVAGVAVGQAAGALPSGESPGYGY